ncbi:HTTM domain-containing protein [Pseudofulvibacter geojedonensis]|uniref:HTTM domain-containing protein n=1 Tax=Pseudofulvibacter geojedonensis TaxID=1123758 RepID=A0ABW3I2U7_9FLAO
MKYPPKLYFTQTTSAASLAVFRIGFGLMMLISIIRFWVNGWIDSVYIQPKFFFSYHGFEWIKPIGEYTYWLFFICGLSAFCVAIGFKYRIAIVSFFLSFTYIELMDKTTYLNHYYFISLMAFVLIFVPANATFSADNLLTKKQFKQVPKWTVDGIKLLLGIVYFYAGLAKINSDWLFRAMPLKIWLPSKYDLPIIGETIMQQEWFHYAMSWSGMLYDLVIPFLLLYKPTRKIAFAAVIFFHVFTWVLFPIGMFPFIMIVSAFIFFDSLTHQKVINGLRRLLAKFFQSSKFRIEETQFYKYTNKKLVTYILATFFAAQLLLPFRYVLYPGELFWTEEGYRFSWRVMLIEKAGYANFKIVDAETGRFFYVENNDFLTSFQEKQMSTQPDFILEYAHFLGNHFKKDGHKNIQVFVESFVGLNGRLSQPFIDPTVDLYQEKESFKHKDWILPFKDKIDGL